MSTIKNTAPIRFGLLGFGNHAQRVFLPVINSATNATLSVIATRGLEKAVEIKSICNTVEVLESYDLLLKHTELDAVYISLPNHLHAEWTVRCLEAGFHVLCEKPIALTGPEEKNIREASLKSKKQVAECFSYRFHPQHQKVRELINSGKLGEVRSISASYSYTIEDPDNIRLQKECRGGALSDVGCYLLDLFRSYSPDGEIKSLKASADFKNGVDVTTSIELVDSNDVLYSLFCGCNSPRTNFYVIQGSKGQIKVKDAFHLPRNKSPQVELCLFDTPPQIITIGKYNQFSSLVDNFCSRIKDNNPINLGITSNGSLLEKVYILINR